MPLFWPSGVYSLGKCIAKNIGWIPLLPIPVYHDHGISIYRELEDHELINPSLYHLTWGSHRSICASNQTFGKRCLYIQHPYIDYRQKQAYAKKSTACGTIFFVPHSTGEIKPQIDIVRWITEAESALPIPKPFVLCLHPTDIQQGVHLDLIRDGYAVVTAGHSEHHAFVDRFYSLISLFSHSVSASPGSEVFLCHDYGLLHTIFIKHKLCYIANTSGVRSGIRRLHPRDRVLYDSVVEAFSSLDYDSNLHKRDQLVADMLGYDSPLSSKFQRRIFFSELLRLLPFIVKSYSSKLWYFLLRRLP